MPPDDVHLQTLLAESEWLRGLARRLCSDPHQADDFAQETWLHALRRLPDARSSPRAWLARVLVNINISRSRSEARRSRRERGAAREEAQPSSAELVERSQIARALAEHVLELDEPGRTVILARFFQGVEVQEIARLQSKSPARVRAELRAGLEDLRRRLERSAGPGWLASLVLLLPSGELPARALRSGRRLPGKLAAAALLFLGGSAVIGLVARTHTGAEEPASAPQALAAETEPADSGAQPKSSSQRQVVDAAADAGAPTSVNMRLIVPMLAAGSIEGSVLRRAGERDSPVEGARVLLWDYAEGCLYGLERLQSEAAPGLAPMSQTRSANDGTFRFSQLQPGDYLVGALVAGTSLRAGYFKVNGADEPRLNARRLAVVLGDASLHGCVRDEEGLPLAGVGVNVLRLPRVAPNSVYYEELRVSTQTGADGRYAIDALPSGTYQFTIGDADASRWPGRRAILTLAAADTLEFDLGEPFPAPHWRGALLCALGEPAASSGELLLHRTLETPRGSKLDVVRTAPLDAAGRFDVTLECARWSACAVLPSSPETKSAVETVEIGRGGLERDLALPGARLRGRVLDTATRQPPAGEVRVHVRRPGGETHGNGAPLDAQGRFVIEMLEPGEWELVVEPLALADGTQAVEFRIDAGEREHEVLVFVRGP